LLAARGVRAGDVVGVRLPNVWQYVALELAVPEMGALIVPLPLALGEHEMGWVLGKTQPRLVVTSAELEALSGPAGGLPTPPIAAPDPARIVEIALSSGTTGMPKLASLSARLKQVTFESFTSRLDITEDDRVLPMTPLTQGIGGMCLYCLRLGAALIMLREPPWSADHFLDAAEAARASVMGRWPANLSRIPARRRPGQGHHHQGRHEHQSVRGGIDPAHASGDPGRLRGRAPRPRAGRITGRVPRHQEWLRAEPRRPRCVLEGKGACALQVARRSASPRRAPAVWPGQSQPQGAP